MMLVDSHAHLDAPEFEDDIEEVLGRAEDENIGAILTIGCLTQNRNTADQLIRLADSKPYLFAAFGVHPHDAWSYDREMEAFCLELMKHPKVIGLGEVGLDFHYDNSPREAQVWAFQTQVRLAISANKPVIIHMRNAEKETLEILEQEFSENSVNSGIMHCFTSSREVAERCIALGFLISLGGILTFKNAAALRETVSHLPEESLLVETDSPYLAPVPNRGKRNEPAFVRQVAEQLAKVKGKEIEEIVEFTGNNFLRLFKLKEDVLQAS
jgi:TatD DNase family protein